MNKSRRQYWEETASLGQTKQSCRRHQAPARHLRRALRRAEYPCLPNHTGGTPSLPPAAPPGQGGRPSSIRPSPGQILLSSNSRETGTPCHLYDEVMPLNLTLIYYSFDFTKSAQRAVIKGSQLCFQKAFLESGIHRACLPAHNPTQQSPGLQTQRAPVPGAHEPRQRGGGPQWGCPSSALCPFWISWFYFYFTLIFSRRPTEGPHTSYRKQHQPKQMHIKCIYLHRHS